VATGHEERKKSEAGQQDQVLDHYRLIRLIPKKGF
jgi:hypothetical protein